MRASPFAQTYSRIFEDSPTIHVGAPEPVIDLAELADHDVPVGLDAVLLQLRPVREETVVMPVLCRSLLHASPRKSGPELVRFVDEVKRYGHQVAAPDPVQPAVCARIFVEPDHIVHADTVAADDDRHGVGGMVLDGAGR